MIVYRSLAPLESARCNRQLRVFEADVPGAWRRSQRPLCVKAKPMSLVQESEANIPGA